MIHQFDTEIAKKYGINIAILLNHLNFWILKNKANDKHFYNGTYWTYNSIKAFHDLFPYLSERQITNALNKMIELGLIKKGNFNTNSYDRTCWYALTNLGVSIMQNCQMEDAKMSNRNVENVEPIPVNIPYNKPDNIYISEEEKNTVTQVILYLNKKANKNYKVEAKCHRTPIQARLRDGYTISDFKKVIDTKVEDWLNTDFNEYLVPETLFRPSNMEKYLNKENKKKEHEVEVTW